MIYKTSLDNLSRVVTLIMIGLFVTLLLGAIFTYTFPFRISSFLGFVILFLVLFFSYLFRTVEYRLSDDEILIHRPIKDVKINRKEIQNLEIIPKEKLTGVIRLFGVGGVFGYFGLFTNAKIGRMTWYATRRSNAILIIMTNNKKIVITPDLPQELVEDYNNKRLYL